MSDVNALDLAFVVDTTGSMNAFIATARKQMLGMIDSLAQAQEIALRLAVVEYRDHPPQDSMVSRVHPFSGKLKETQKTLNGLRTNGGGDGPEAVFDGIKAACDKLQWQPHARRLIVLVGDAPPHGVGAAGDGFPRGCPCGDMIGSVTAAVEKTRATLCAVGLTPFVRESFGQLSRMTGGDYFDSGNGTDAIARLEAILRTEFSQIEFDRRLLEVVRSSPRLPMEVMAERLGSSRPAVSASVSRLGSRGLL